MIVKKDSVISVVSYFLITVWFLIAFTSSASNCLFGYRVCFVLLIVQLFARLENGYCKIKNDEMRFVVWVFGYAALGALSSIWALSSEYALATAKMLCYTAIGPLALLMFIDNVAKLKNVLNIIIITSGYMILCIVFHLKDSIRPDIVINNATELYFNTISQMLAFLIVFAYALVKLTKRKVYYIYILAAYAVIIYAGSRKSLLFPIIVICFVELYSAKNLNKKMKNIFLILLLVLLLYVAVSSDELLYSRMQNLFAALSGDVSADASAMERYYYRDLALSMFAERPFLGYGMDNFQVKLIQLHYGHIAYSHNNWTEVASNLGIVGLVSYYWFYFYIIKENIAGFKKKNYVAVLIIAIVTSFMVFEYGIVSYGIQFYKVVFVILLCTKKIISSTLVQSE